jgi:isopentenyl phosphate kinase
MKSGSGKPILVKLGGSLITDKTREATARLDVIRRLATEIKEALESDPELKLVVGHGSGSFGHFPGKRYGVRDGVKGPEGWKGFAETASAAARLNRLVTETMLSTGIKAFPMQPSASLLCRDGEIVRWEWQQVRRALERGLIPIIYGDVAFDEVRGSTIVSTDELFFFLAQKLRPSTILLVGKVAGVFTADPLLDPEAKLIPEVTPSDWGKILGALRGSYGVDVTGGMEEKVKLMLKLVEMVPGLKVVIMSGEEEGALRNALLGSLPERCTIFHS